MLFLVCLTTRRFTARSNINPFTDRFIHWWQKLQCKVPAARQDQYPLTYTHTPMTLRLLGIEPPTFWSVNNSTSWASSIGEAFFFYSVGVTCRLMSQDLNSKPNQVNATLTKRPLIFTDYLSFFTTLNQSQAFRAWWGCWWTVEETYCPQCYRSYRKLTVGRNNHGMISCPCMDYIFWWKVEIESSENRHSSCGLSWCLFTNLAAPASLLLTPCWQMLANCLCCK